MYQLPFTAEILIACTLVLQAPVTLQLLSHGLVPQTIGATVIGVLLGRQLRPAASHTTVLTALVVSGTWWTVDLLLPAGVDGQLLDQLGAAAFVVMLWPDGPGGWFRRRLHGMLRTARQWSTGMPIAGV